MANHIPESEAKYIWRCARCGCHFANIIKSEGNIKQEKKCPKCKALNTLTLTQKEIFLYCKNHNGDSCENGSHENGNYNNAYAYYSQE